MAKVIAFNGSARKRGNTAMLIDVVLDELKKKGIKTEVYALAYKRARVSYMTGMRPAEAAYLAWFDINFEMRNAYD